MPSTHQRGNSDRDPSSKEAYERLLSCIRHNTTDDLDKAQRPSSLEGQIFTILHGEANIPIDQLRGAMEVAVSRGDVLRWRGRDGQMRVCLVEESYLQALIRYESQQAHPNQELIGEANRLVQALRGGRDE